MSLSLDSATRDTICLKAFGQAYSSLNANQKLLVDNNGGTGGDANNALTMVQQLAQWLTQAGIDTTATSLADTLKSLLISLAVKRLVASHKPERLPIFEKEYDDAFDLLVDNYSRVEANATSSQGTAYTVQGIRQYVIDHCLRRKPRVFPMIGNIDSQIQWVINHIWARRWNFRIKSATGTVDSSSVVTFSLSGSNTFDSLATRRIYYTDQPETWMQSVNMEDMQRLRASSASATGRPTTFTVQKGASGTTWLFYPVPDQTYNIRAAVYIGAPSITSSSTDAGLLSDFPATFKPLIRDMVLARVLKQHNLPDGDEKWRDATNQMESDAKNYYDDRGEPPTEASVRDVYGDVESITGGPFLGWFQAGGRWY